MAEQKLDLSCKKAIKAHRSTISCSLTENSTLGLKEEGNFLSMKLNLSRCDNKNCFYYNETGQLIAKKSLSADRNGKDIIAVFCEAP